MNKDTLSLILTSLAGGLVGALAPLVIYLLNRKSQIRLTGTQSDVNTATAKSTEQEVSSKLITQLQQDGETYRGMVRELQTDLQTLKERHERDQRAFSEQLTIAHEENLEMASRVARLRTELDIARRQINDLTSRGLPADPATGRF